QPALSPQSAAPTTPSQNVIPPQSTLQPLQPPDPEVAEPPPASPSDIATAEIQVRSTSLPVDRSGGTRVSYTRSPRWLRPAVITALMVALLAGAWVGLRSFLPRTVQDPAKTHPNPEPAKPNMDELQARESDALNIAGKSIASDDLGPARSALVEVASLNGPLN